MAKSALGNHEILLASASPRRRQLLRSAGVEPRVRPVDVPEPVLPKETGEEMVRRLAQEKAQAALVAHPDADLILAADTTVLFRGEVLGKPANAEAAVEMLMSLPQDSHRVITAITLVGAGRKERLTAATKTDLFMRPYNRAEVERYAAGGSPLDKAGGYGIQDEDFMPVDMGRFQGCFTNVMGLPLCTLGRMLETWGYEGTDQLIDACFEYHRHELQPIGDLENA